MICKRLWRSPMRAAVYSLSLSCQASRSKTVADDEVLAERDAGSLPHMTRTAR